MTDKKTEALRLALEALEKTTDAFLDTEGSHGAEQSDAIDASYEAITAIREALAEQPAQQQCPHDFLMGDDEPGHDSVCMQCGAAVPNDEPAQQQEPVALSQAVYTVLEGFTLPHDVRKILESAYYSDQPASKPWVGLTEEQRHAYDYLGPDVYTAIKETEAKLREKNAHVTESRVQREPVAWRYKIVDCFGRAVWTLKTPKTDTRVLESQPLYTTPQPAVPERKPLTDEEIHKASTQAGMQEHYMGFHSGFIRFARAIEASHGIKENT